MVDFVKANGRGAQLQDKMAAAGQTSLCNEQRNEHKAKHEQKTCTINKVNMLF